MVNLPPLAQHCILLGNILDNFQGHHVLDKDLSPPIFHVNKMFAAESDESS